METLPTIFTNAISALQVLYGCPPEMARQIVLGVASYSTQGLYNFDPVLWAVPGDRGLPLSLAIVAVMGSGGKKTSASDACMEGIERFAKEHRKTIDIESEKHALEMQLYESAVKDVRERVKANAMTTKEGAVAMLKAKPRPIMHANLLMKKPTLNGLINKLSTLPMSALFNDDAGEFLASHSMRSDDAGLEMAAAFSTLWSKGAVERSTGMDETSLRNRRMTLFLMAQPAVVDKLFNNPQFNDQGFIPRVLVTHSIPPDLTPFGTSSADVVARSAAKASLEMFNERSYQLLQDAFNGFQRAEDPMECALDVLEWRTDAKALLIEWYDTVFVPDMNGGVYDGLHQAFARRLPEHAMRLAGVLSVFEKRVSITAENMAAGIELMRFYYEQRMSLDIADAKQTVGENEIGRMVLDWMRDHGNDGVDRKTLAQAGPAKYRALDGRGKDNLLNALLADDFISVKADGKRQILRAN